MMSSGTATFSHFKLNSAAAVPCCTPFTPANLSVLYVEAGDDGMQIRKLRVDARGQLLDPWRGGFFEERVQELF